MYEALHFHAKILWVLHALELRDKESKNVGIEQVIQKEKDMLTSYITFAMTSLYGSKSSDMFRCAT
mgnify:CR=1 FL=1